MEPSPQRAWQLVDTIGPLFSHFGLKNWDLCLARDAVIECPRSLWLTVEARPPVRSRCRARVASPSCFPDTLGLHRWAASFRRAPRK